MNNTWKMLKTLNIVFFVAISVLAITFLFNIKYVTADIGQPINYQPLAPIPGITDKLSGGNISASTGVDGFKKYIQGIFTFGIGLCAALAVIMIIYGGFMYVVNSGNEGKIKEGRDIIKNAVEGLVMALCIVIILQAVNSSLLTGDIFGDFKQETPQINDENVPINLGPQVVYPGQNGYQGNGTAPYYPGLNQSGPPQDTTDAAAKIAEAAEAAANQQNGLTTSGVPGTNNGKEACAYAVNQIINNATGQPINSSLSTTDMYNSLQNNPAYSQISIDEAQPGDIIISPTQGSVYGHVGICDGAGCDAIISNSSAQGHVESNFTAQSWQNYYGGKGLPVYVYRANDTGSGG